MSDLKSKTTLGRWRWVLIPSLALNLIIVGFATGFVLRDPDERRGGPPMAPAVMTLLRALPSDVQADLRENARAAFGRGNWQDRMARSENERSALISALRAEPFDRAQVADVLDGRRNALTENYETLQSVLLDRLEALSTEDRAAIALKVEEDAARRFKKD
ncbi:MAG: periplasmic heavy metal sensor [Pseudomonadota bacterium]